MVSLVNFLGDEKIRFQVVHKSIEGNVSMLKDGSTKFTMVTEQANLVPGDLTADKPRRYGLLLWVDAKDFDSWMADRPALAPGCGDGV